MKFTRRQTLAAALGSLGAGVLPRAQAQTQPFPSQVIKFVIPTPAGGDHDTMMRIIGQKLTDAWGQPCIVESRSGASGAIAAATVSQAPADGYTVLIGYSALLSNTVLMPKPGYRLEDLQPVGMLALTPIAFGVRESLPASTLKQYVALAKTRPGKLSYGSYGQGSGGHFVGELFNMAAGIGGYTFIYAEGASYLTNDPAACANCHVMKDHFDAWAKSGHHHVAVCNDCHTPHDLLGKYWTKARNGWHHSQAFTTGNFHEPIQITPVNRAVTEAACRYCHQDIVQAIDRFPHDGKALSCIQCHASVGHDI